MADSAAKILKQAIHLLRNPPESIHNWSSVGECDGRGCKLCRYHDAVERLLRRYDKLKK